MSKFKGFELIKVLRAVTNTSPGADTDLTHQYEVEIHSMMGTHFDKTYMGINELHNTYSKELGASDAKERFAILQQGEVSTLNEEQYQEFLSIWEAK